MTEDLDPYRLPTTVVPDAYRLRIEPDLQAARFAGSVEIDVDVAEATDTVTLNAVDLELDDPVAAPEGRAPMTGGGERDAAHERATLRFPAPLGAGRHVLRIGFRGTLNDELVGFYRSTFVDESGTTHTIATTQFEATDARRAFPCFDEPTFKATFAVTLVVPAGLTSVSNGAITSEASLDDGRREVRFATTMRMSTYLVAFVVGPFESTAPIDVGGVPIAVVHPPGKGDLTAFALEIGAFSLRFFEEYFGLPYPGDKVDLVGIPDFAYGAMENLGCVTFREMELLVDPQTASQNELIRIATVVAHELAHMWFGDLVTMAWWEGLWLNEAFATYMCYVCCDAFRPEWKMWVRFSGERELGLMVDVLHSTRSIEFPVRAPQEAMAMADPITYQKGSSVLKMLEAYLGEDVFRDGIRHYLRTHRYANTVTRDLWDALEAVSGVPVGEIMHTWIFQGGHPVVMVDGRSLSQRPCTLGPPDGPSSIGGPWIVPVRARSLGGGEPTSQILRDAPIELAAAQPAIVNAGGAGFYRTSYGDAQLASIAGRFDELSENERAVIVGDTLALARTGERTLADVLVLARRLGTAVDPACWDVVDRALDFLARMVDEADRPALAGTTRELLGPMFSYLGWEPRAGEDERAQLIRATLLRRLGTTGKDQAVRDEATARFDSGVVEGDLAQAIVDVVASLVRPGDYDEMLRRLREAKDPLTEERYRQGIAATADTATCLHTLDGAFDLFRMQDAPIVVARLTFNPVAGRAVWEAVTERWDALIEKVPMHMHFVLALGLSAMVEDEPFARRAAAFHRAHPLAAAQIRVDQALEMLLSSARMAERERPRLATTLA